MRRRSGFKEKREKKDQPPWDLSWLVRIRGAILLGRELNKIMNRGRQKERPGEGMRSRVHLSSRNILYILLIVNDFQEKEEQDQLHAEVNAKMNLEYKLMKESLDSEIQMLGKVEIKSSSSSSFM